MVESLSAKEIVEYPNGGKSYFYVIDRMVIIVDEGILDEFDIFVDPECEISEEITGTTPCTIATKTIQISIKGALFHTSEKE